MHPSSRPPSSNELPASRKGLALRICKMDLLAAKLLARYFVLFL